MIERVVESGCALGLSPKQNMAKIAACALKQRAMDFDGNAASIIRSIRGAEAAGATIRCGPELEVTGYSCGDHFLEPETVRRAWDSLARVMRECTSETMLWDVGMYSKI